MSIWPVRKLGEVCHVRRGTTITQKRARDGAVPVVGGGTVPTYYHDTANRPAGTITISGSGASAGFVNRYSVPIFASDCSTVEPLDGTSLLADFVFRFLQSKQEWINAELRQGAAQPHVYASDIAQIAIPFPPLVEQRRIVAFLDKALAAIATATVNTEKNLTNARELPGTFIDAILVAEPDQQTFVLADTADSSCTLSYGIVQPGDEFERGLPIVRPVDLQQEVVGLKGLKRIDPKIAAAYSRTALRGDEIFLCVRGTTGTVSLASPELAGGNVTRGIVPIRFDPSLVSRDFGYYLMRSAAVQKQIRAATYGTALMQINIGDLKRISVRVPSLEKQAALSGRLGRLSLELGVLRASYSQKIAALGQLKQSLLHRAFSGEPLGRQLLAA